MTTSVKTYSNAAVDALAENSVTPHDIVCQLEEAWQASFIKRAPLIPILMDPLPRKQLNKLVVKSLSVSIAESLRQIRTNRYLADAKWKQRSSLYSAFGRYGLEKDEKAIIAQAKEGLESVEDRLAAVYYAIERIKSRKLWKIEQNKPQDPSACTDTCLTYDLPPRTKGRSHQPAYYSITGPKGGVIDLSKADRHWKPKLCKNPNEAFRAFMTRRGVDIKGGEVQILNMILQEPMVEITNGNGEIEKCYKWLPSYVTTHCGAWFVTVGWRLNPKCTPSRYWVDANGELTQEDPNKGLPIDHEAYTPPLTLSELDYHLLKESADLAVTNEEDETVEFMNEEEEFLTCFPQREEEPDFVDFSKWCEDDEEMELFGSVSSVVERSENGITLGDIRSKSYQEDYLQYGIERMQTLIRKIVNSKPLTPEAEAADLKWLEIYESNLKRLERLERLSESLLVDHSDNAVRHWYPIQHAMFTMGRDFDSLKEPVKTLPCMTIEPLNEIEKPKQVEWDFRPTRSRTFQMTLGQSKQLRRQKQVAQAIIHNRFGLLVREKKAAQTFADTLDTLLGV